MRSLRFASMKRPMAKRKGRFAPTTSSHTASPTAPSLPDAMSVARDGPGLIRDEADRSRLAYSQIGMERQKGLFVDCLDRPDSNDDGGNNG